MVSIVRHKKPIRKLTLVPMINVIFMLVFFFLVGGRLQDIHLLDIEAPKAASGQLLDEGPIEVLLGKYDEVIVNDQLLEDAQLYHALKEQLAQNPARVMTIKADRHASANRFIAFMEQARKAGAKNISLVTQNAGDSEPVGNLSDGTDGSVHQGPVRKLP